MGSLRNALNEAATKAVFEAEWDTVTWEDAKKGYRENDAWDAFREDHAFYYQAGEDAVTLVLDVLADRAFDDQAFSDEPLVGVCLADHVALSGLSGLFAVLRGVTEREI